MYRTEIKKIVVLLMLFTFIFTTFFYMGNQLAYADDKIKPDITLYIHGEKTNGGPIFHQSGDIGDGLWAPGISHSGTMRIYNNYSERVKISNLGLAMELEQLQGQEYERVTDKELYEQFAKNMKLTIKKGTMLIFSNKIYEKSFYEMLYNKDEDDYNGYNLSSTNEIRINTNNYIDLEYTVSMDNTAGNELQGLKATVDFIINSHENPQEPEKPNKPDKPDKPNKEKPIDADEHWAHDCIQTLLEHGIIQGYPDGTIRPENYITRAETAVLVAKAVELEEKEGFTGYIDFIPSWAKGYVKSGSEKGFLKGYPNKTFKPDKDISRQEMIAILIRAFEKEIKEDVSLDFLDNQEISMWALRYVDSGVYYKVIEGYPDNTFKPKNNITRAEAFTIICKLLGYHNEHASNNN